MKVKLKILSPIHIGSGEEISPIEYFIEGNQFHRLNMDGLFNDNEFKPNIDKFIELAKTTRYIGKLLPNSLLKKYILYTIPIKGEALAYISNNQTVVKEYIKSAGYVYIPGSSIKGSIFSAILWHYLAGMGKNGKDKETVSAREFISDALQDRYGRDNYNKLLNLAFSRFTKDTKKSRFSQWLSVSDSDRKKPAEALQLSLAKVKGAKSGRELPILYEALQPNSEFAIDIDAQHSNTNENKIIEIVNEFYRKVLTKDKSNIESKANLIRLGQGSSAYATSFLILAEDLGIKNYRLKPPATKKRIDNTIPLGWAEIIEVR